MTEIKTCMNCAYHKGWDVCSRSDCSTRRTKVFELGCDVHFSGWKEIPKVIKPPKNKLEEVSKEMVKRKSWIRRVLGL